MSPRSLRLLRLLRLLWPLALLPATPARAQADDTFGRSSVVEGQGALIGILYDFKQTQQRKPTDQTARTYAALVAEFINADWDEAVLNRYFRVTRPLYATRVFIPHINADQAPKAFGVEDVMQPRQWVVHYKGQVAPPEDGVYRFSGFADDFIAARADGRTVLVAGRHDAIDGAIRWRASAPDSIDLPGGKLRHGDWMTLKAGEAIDLDVLVGERPGGGFSAYLYVEKQSAPMSPPPVFKLAPEPTPATPHAHGPDTGWSVWSAKQ